MKPQRSHVAVSPAARPMPAMGIASATTISASCESTEIIGYHEILLLDHTEYWMIIWDD